jgi:hypothetical protein
MGFMRFCVDFHDLAPGLQTIKNIQFIIVQKETIHADQIKRP